MAEGLLPALSQRHPRGRCTVGEDAFPQRHWDTAKRHPVAPPEHSRPQHNACEAVTARAL
eukprot:1310107-Alexandrium_andersonii.AAC.1